MGEIYTVYSFAGKCPIPSGIWAFFTLIALPPKEYTVYISSTLEYILGIDILQGQWLQTTSGEFRLRVCVVKAVLRGHAKHLPVALPVPWQVTNTKQYKLAGEQKEIGETLQELEKVGIIKPTHSPFNSPVC